MTEIIENCQLEWHQERGVLYVHNKDTGATVFRICGLAYSSYMSMLANSAIDIGIYSSDDASDRPHVGISYPPTK